MNKNVIIITILLVLVAIASLLSVSYFWFTTESKLELGAATLVGSPLNLALNISLILDQDAYMGQTGKGRGLDAPYSADFNVEMTYNDSNSYNKNLRLGFNYANIKKWNYAASGDGEEMLNYFDLSDEEIRQNFTWRLLYKGKVYQPDSDGFAYYTSLDKVSYLTMSTQDVTDCVLRIIYLGEESYGLWQEEKYMQYEDFAYCDTEFMRATFGFSMEFEMTDAEQKYDEKIGFEVNDKQFALKSGNYLNNLHKFEYSPTIYPMQSVSEQTKGVKAHIEGVSILKRNGDWEYLGTEEINNNFTLRIDYGGVTYAPDPSVNNKYLMFKQYGQNYLWLTLDSMSLSDLLVTVVCQDEEDYSSMLLGLAGYPKSLFGYSSATYQNAIFYYDIHLEMVDIPQALSQDYVFGSQVTMGLMNSGYMGETGSSANTYSFTTPVSWTASNVTILSNKVKATITSVTIIKTDGTVSTLTTAQINNNFSIKAYADGESWIPKPDNPDRDLLYKKGVIINEFLKLAKDTKKNVDFEIIYSNGSSFGFTGEEYEGATFMFDVKIEVTN